MVKRQVKTSQRVHDHGEVFTSENEVNAMLDLVLNETERIESRFLEPACGDGNFLVEILRRKLKVVDKLFGKNFEWESYSILALSSLYGVDILYDNVIECRDRLFEIWYKAYKKAMKSKPDEDLNKTIMHILNHNILVGDALTMKNNNGGPIIFSQWDMIIDSKFQRRDYRLDELIEGQNKTDSSFTELTLFGNDNGDNRSDFDKQKDWIFDDETKGYIPGPIKDDYPIVEYRRLKDYE
ncbi:MAG: SAM-dependent DNA methyltransferase [Bacilli bacterium]